MAAPSDARRSARGKAIRLSPCLSPQRGLAMIMSALDLAQGAQAYRGMNFVLAHHHGLGPEALDDRAHKGADLRAGQKDRHFILAAGLVKSLADLLDELLQLRRRHRQL